MQLFLANFSILFTKLKKKKLLPFAWLDEQEFKHLKKQITGGGGVLFKGSQFNCKILFIAASCQF